MANEITLQANADAYIRTDLDVRRNDNYGQNQEFRVGTGRGGGEIPYGGADAIRSLLQFDLSMIPTDTVENATLELTIFDIPSGPASSEFVVDIHPLLGSWSEGNGYEGPSSSLIGAPPGAVWVDPADGVAWAGAGDNPAPDAANNQTQPDFDPVVIASAAVNQSTAMRGDVVQWDITSLVNDWLAGVLPNNGILLRDMTTDNTFRELQLGSREGDVWDFPGTSPEPVTGPRLFIALSDSTSPSSLTVDTLIDENDGDLSPGDVSLREAIAAVTEGGTVTFDPSLNNGTIVLDEGELVINKSLTLDAEDKNITIDTNQQSRVFLIDDGTSILKDITIDGLTITDGFAQEGGGIWARENLTLKNSTITGNNGGIFGDDYYGINLQVESSVISGNFADGIRWGGSNISINRSEITANQGNGIYSNYGMLELANSTISGNVGNGISGGYRTVISGSTVSDNQGHGFTSVSPYISDSVLIKDDSIITGNGGNGVRFYTYIGGTVDIQNSTISGNTGVGVFTDSARGGPSTTISQSQINANGGGVYTKEDLEISDSLVSGNQGVGIRQDYGGPISVVRTTISDNNGTGVVSRNAKIVDSTISRNRGDLAGGIINKEATTRFDDFDGSLEIVNSTISQNTGSLVGGVLNTPHPDYGGYSNHISIQNSTIVGNVGGAVGGLLNQEQKVSPFSGSPTFTIANSIIADNEGVLPDISGGLTSLGFNLIGDSTGSTSFNHPNDLVGTSSNPLNPGLGNLASNGGSTETHALLPESPAIDAGDPNFSPPPDFDQRGSGFDRIINGQIDIGAFELQDPIAPPIVLDVGLYNAKTDQRIATLAADGSTVLSLDDIQGIKLTIAAFTENGSVESMFLDLNGQFTRTENVVPYALFGDINSDFKGQRNALNTGENRITFDLFSENRLGGDFLGAISRSFTVVENQAPIAQDDTAEAQGSSTVIDVLANDSDPDGDVLAIESFTQPEKGEVVQSGNDLIYLPDPVPLEGADQFEYTISDGNGGTDTATVTLSGDPISGVSLAVGLFDTVEDTLIQTIKAGDEIWVDSVNNLTIAAVVVEGSLDVESMALNLFNPEYGSITRIENVEPYALFGDRDGDYFNGSLPLGANTLMLESFSQDNGKGLLVDTFTVDFTLLSTSG
jgi:hypothetical protein